jgi:hypothetical protein
MNTPINIDELKAIKIYPSKERFDIPRILMENDWVYRDEMGQSNFEPTYHTGFFCDISPAGLDLWAEQAHKRVMQSVDDYCLEQSLRINQLINWPDITLLYQLHVSYNVGQRVYFKPIDAPKRTVLMEVTKKATPYYYDIKPVKPCRYNESIRAHFYEIIPY